MRKQLILLAVLIFCTRAHNLNAFTVQVNAANYEPHADCHGVTPGYTDLIPAVTMGLPDPTSLYGSQLLHYLQLHYPDNEPDMPGGATFIYTISATSLTGTLHVDWYKARDWENGNICHHGADISLHYEHGPGDPDELDWIQFVTESGDSGNRYMHVDGRQQDTDDGWPYYFHMYDNPADFYVKDLELPEGDIFGDYPYDGHDERFPAQGITSFELFLATNTEYDIDTNSYTITLYNGMTWGYKWGCAPEPATVILFVMSVLGAFLRFKK
ncbi:MAG: hypothetical protein C4541_10735 [Candidatus Auribacter fodinae]|jgi:hypothetical protein|uniref:PEP-CTERM sorting domain-containing protein n=1 Tax=Candidatus Auribacter fodinae TaxID=2093366 RepID=A0A3A4QXY2_9BACT|nr:MAG: hypothetical protein C4541_10735 [Candidatus Auribacter fodinae]